MRLLPERVGLEAFAWGLAEATLFFIVPDVLLSGLALKQSMRRVVHACLWALAGALLGGVLMYFWGRFSPITVLGVLREIPAIDLPMCEEVTRQLRDEGLFALFIGPLTGTPYKIYAAMAGALALNPLLFFAISIPARLLRFLAVAGLVRLICRAFPGLSLGGRMGLWAVGWLGFYGWYFSHFAG
ncbi:YqaA family protein [Uliginosibacterium sp. 31-12]|uniref:YqaA family protein n=1 Tax=Uliginosibacterium sp. 31-12 TaxID=3062781 RepID=UPI0026E25243|nr:hypothetical protein [Uliginosibacterium sp. 31-12]MDO6386885.1 hypothetical protein [Uliginosibacterium sp. 31-12]